MGGTPKYRSAPSLRALVTKTRGSQAGETFPMTGAPTHDPGRTKTCGRRGCARSPKGGHRVLKRIELVELIEGEIAKLSAKGKEVWVDIELWIHTPRLDMDLAEIMRIFEETGNPPESDTTVSFGEPGDPPKDEATIVAPKEDKATIMTLFWLWLGITLADTEERLKELLERRGEAHEVRELFVVKAAQARNHFEGRQIDRDMTLQQALARLKEGT